MGNYRGRSPARLKRADRSRGCFCLRQRAGRSDDTSRALVQGPDPIANELSAIPTATLTTVPAATSAQTPRSATPTETPTSIPVPGMDFSDAYVLGVTRLQDDRSMVRIQVPAGVVGEYSAEVETNRVWDYMCVIPEGHDDRLYCVGPLLAQGSQATIRVYSDEILLFESTFIVWEVLASSTPAPKDNPAPTSKLTPTPTSTPTHTPISTSTSTHTPTGTSTPTATNTPIPPTETRLQLNIPTLTPSTTPSPTPLLPKTPVPPTPTALPTDTPLPPSSTPKPTHTPVPPTATP